MIANTTEPLTDLYEADETAWLDAMSELIGEGRFSDLDYSHLKEFLEDMARSDRRKVKSRLEVLIAHILKWIHQPDKRTPSWRGTIVLQRHKLADLLASGSLRNHAVETLADVYARAVELASTETQLPIAAFPEECPWTLDQLLSKDLLGE